MNKDIKQFAQELTDKGCEKLTKKGLYDHSIMEMIRQMIEHKMTKEKWTNGN